VLELTGVAFHSESQALIQGGKTTNEGWVGERWVAIGEETRACSTFEGSTRRDFEGGLERFTEQARRVLFFARYEASQLGSIDIDTEHVLLGLIREGKGLTNRLFAEAGIALDDIRDEVLRRVGVRTKISTSVEIPFSTAAKRVLQHTAEEADRLLHDCIGTQHLLLGLLREQGCVAADVLTSRGLRLDSVRGQIVQFLSDGERPERPGPPGIPANTFK
jgi:ATP-dependent Clp protease ATP-binding subunit ClpA